MVSAFQLNAFQLSAFQAASPIKVNVFIGSSSFDAVTNKLSYTMMIAGTDSNGVKFSKQVVCTVAVQ